MGKKFNPRIDNILCLVTLMIRLYSRTFYYEDKARKATPKTYKRSKRQYWKMQNRIVRLPDIRCDCMKLQNPEEIGFAKKRIEQIPDIRPILVRPNFNMHNNKQTGKCLLFKISYSTIV